MRIIQMLQRTFQLEGKEFVTELYRQLLNREVELSEELPQWVGLLDAGVSKMELAIKIMGSPEALTILGLDDLSPPDGYFLTTGEWTRSANAYFTSYEEFDQGACRTVRPPKSVQAGYSTHFHIPRSNSQFVAVVPGGRVIGPNGAVITSDHKLLIDVSIEYDKPPELHSAMNLEQLPPVTYTAENLAVLSTAGPYNYFHWMYDVLPRLDLLQRSGVQVDRYLISRGNGTFPFQDATLSAMGIPTEKLLVCYDDTHLKAKNLIISSMAGWASHVPKWACDFVRQKLMVDRGIKPEYGFEKLYISRAGAHYRRIINEAQVTELLEQQGFVTVQLEKLGLDDQIRLFASAEIIVSPHGAGLANLTFCQPGAKIVELFPPTYVNGLYWILACQMNLDYSYLVGQGEQQTTDTNYYIDVHALKRTLLL